MNKQEKQNLTVLAKKALKEYFGFCPTLKQIVLLESYCNNNFCEYLAFSRYDSSRTDKKVMQCIKIRECIIMNY